MSRIGKDDRLVTLKWRGAKLEVAKEIFTIFSSMLVEM